MEFIDLDFYITQRFRKSVPDLFAERGEEGFRRLECNMLREVGCLENVVVSCGGGTPCFFDNMDFMNANGLTVWLQASTERIARRLLIAKTQRPIMQGKTPEELPAFIEKHLAEREPYYSQAQKILNSEELESASAIGEAVDRLKDLVK